MLPLHALLLFALAALLLVLTPGPNMIYLLSRAVIQGRRAGLLSLLGVLLGFLVHMLAASLGLTALFLAIPYAYSAVKLAGAVYLLWLAWNAVRPGGASPFEARRLPHDPPARLLQMGFLTNLLNPKVAVFYMALLPQFLQPGHGSALAQSLLLGSVQIAVSASVNLLLVLFASRLAAFFATRPTWLKVQRSVMAMVLGGLALRIAVDRS
ncbi:LysE family translocator [Deinococcus sp. KNUC1210]|uniref:LysE family translocator n=1 Tax=Deinococcus sp. KNUC1210 TaxID=2917691 RepID=UPI001EEF7F34|nr:LysE family translocator [Deinococcus sp. KNUC1210]ULH15466.1 LysE family translocator [Deinococcus sp. KNUC1210]